MSDEEKNAIEWLKSKINEYVIKSELDENIEIILNLIKKQSKEIEELNKENTRQHELIGNIHQKWKDKIKAKIEEIKEEKEHYLEMNDEYNAQICDCIIEEYESLLEKE